jgi:hypothetical protein
MMIFFAIMASLLKSAASRTVPSDIQEVRSAQPFIIGHSSKSPSTKTEQSAVRLAGKPK